MHASIPELLSLRDAEPIDARVAQHIESCPECTRELTRLASVRARLQNLPSMDAPSGAWERIQRNAARPPPTSPRRRWLGAAAVGALAVIVGVTRLDEPSTPPDELIAVSEPSASGRAPVDALVERSQELEQLLQALPQRPMIERVSTSATIDTLEQRIQWLDYQLSYASEGALDDAQSERLWRERVELMDSLVKVRSAEAGRLTF